MAYLPRPLPPAGLAQSARIRAGGPDPTRARIHVLDLWYNILKKSQWYLQFLFRSTVLFLAFLLLYLCFPSPGSHNINISAHLLNSIIHTEFQNRFAHTLVKYKPKRVQDLFIVIFVFRLRVFSQVLNLVICFHTVLLCYSLEIQSDFCFLSVCIQF